MEAFNIGSAAISSGIENANNFGFILDAHSFKLLSNSLYSNKILAPLREYTTNAIDSLIASGNEALGYVVHLPNDLEPFWSIRDYGLGIPDEQMPDLFCFNKSNKRTSNKLNGVFGLGSKSFLAVSDSATFTSFYNGTKHVYMVYTDKGMPTFSKAIDCETDEPNGLEVKFPIATHKFNELIQTYKDFCRYVSIKPTIVGYDNVIWDTYQKNYLEGLLDLGGGCKLEKRCGGTRKDFVVFGNVAYPISSYYKYRTNRIFNIPIGSVDIVPSREALEMTEKTVAFLANINKTFEDQFDNYIKHYHIENGFLNTFKHLENFIDNLSEIKVNGKGSRVKLKVDTLCRFNFAKNKIQKLDGNETLVEYDFNVLIDSDPTVSYKQSRVKKFLDSNRGHYTVILSDKESIEKYCAHFEVDIDSIKHIKDVEPYKKPSSYTKTRFTGLRYYDRGGAVTGHEIYDLDLSTITEMYFVYRNGSQLYEDAKYTVQVNDFICTVTGHKDWRDVRIYVLTSRQHKKLSECGIRLINLVKHIRDSVDEMTLEHVAKYELYLSDLSSLNKGIPEIEKIIPNGFHFILDARNSIEYSTHTEKVHIVKALDIYEPVYNKYKKVAIQFNNSDIGKFLELERKHGYMYRISKDFIRKVIEVSVA